MIGFNHIWPKREMTPLEEIAVNLVSGALIPAVLVAFWVVKVTKFTSTLWRKKTWG